MPYNNGKITAPVSIYDVRRALNASANDVGRLCAHQKINKWAKFKPIHVPNVVAQLTWQGMVAQRLGMECIYASTEAAFNNKLAEYTRYLEGSHSATFDGFADGVRLMRPTGTMSSPYRLSDFACKENPNLGYHKAAELQWQAPKVGGGFTAAIGAVLGDDEYTYTNNAGDNLPQFESYSAEWDYWDGASLNRSMVNDPATAPYLDLSVQEILMAGVEVPGRYDMYRGVVLVSPDGSMVLSCYQYNEGDLIPWGQWRDDLVAANYWWRFETYLFTQNYCLIPGMQKKISFNVGQYSIAFAQHPDNGIMSYSQSLMKYTVRAGFRVVAGTLADWNLRIEVKKKIGDQYSASYFSGTINAGVPSSNITVETSGDTYYMCIYGIDYQPSDPSQSIDNPGDQFVLEIYGSYNGTTEQLLSSMDYYLTL